ncbi:unnamed protein product [Caenorhabditis brenneri]
MPIVSFSPPYFTVALGVLTIGLIVFLMKTLSQLRKVCAENERVLALLMEQRQKDSVASEAKATEEKTETPEDSEKIFDESSEYQIPFFDNTSECGTPDINGDGTPGSSGYNSESEKEMEQLLNIIRNAPPGPVPMEQTYLAFTCINSGRYVKAIVDIEHTEINVVTWRKNENGDCFWMPSSCRPCFDLIRRTLAEGGCKVPLAVDLEDPEYIRRRLAEYEAANETMMICSDCYDEEDNESGIYAVPWTSRDYHGDAEFSPTSDVESQFTDESKGMDSDNPETDFEEGSAGGMYFDSTTSSEEDKENLVIEKPISTIFDLDAFDFSQADFEYDDVVLE